MIIDKALAKVFGTANERELKRLAPIVIQVNAFEPSIEALSDEQLRGKTAEFRLRLEQGETLDDLLPEAFAVVREAGRRTLNMRHFDVQLIGGMVLHRGKIAEMKTGEGKTLVATLPAYLNALAGQGVHVVDSILIDEARTPLIISGPAEESTDLYYEVDRIIPRLSKGATTRGDVKAEEREELEKTGDYIVDEKHKTVTLTESGMSKAEKMLAQYLQAGSDGLYDPVNMRILHHVNQALRAHSLFHLDVEYMVKDKGDGTDEVVIVDEFTGRLMPGRRWSDGLHQAVEAKEHNAAHPRVKIERENQTLATVTFQNYFRKYKKLSGMTGTADTEAQEFADIYKLDVMVIPTNRVMQRKEEADVVYKTEREKYDAIVADILE